MAELDTKRATFVLAESRFIERVDNPSKALNPAAKIVTVPSSLSETIALGLAEQLLAETKDASEGYSVTIEGIYTVEELIGGGPARFSMTAPVFNVSGRTMKVTGFSVDPFGAGLTTLTVRG